MAVSWDESFERHGAVEQMCEDLGVEAWQTRLIQQIVGADTPDDLWCHRRTSEQYRLGVSYQQLMESHALDVLRRQER